MGKNKKPPNHYNKKKLFYSPLIIIIILIFLVIIFIIIRSFRKEEETGKYSFEEAARQAESIADMERDKLVSMLPEGYDTKMFERSWNDFIQALADNRAHPHLVNEFMFALKDALEDRKLDKQEADKLIQLMKAASQR